LKETVVQTRGGTKTYSKEKSALQKINDLCLVGYGRDIMSSYDPTKTINSEVYCQQLD
jgi:activator of 2-hydroxyglutaryl-CoA dehydratase